MNGMLIIPPPYMYSIVPPTPTELDSIYGYQINIAKLYDKTAKLLITLMLLSRATKMHIHMNACVHSKNIHTHECTHTSITVPNIHMHTHTHTLLHTYTHTPIHTGWFISSSEAVSIHRLARGRGSRCWYWSH